MQRAHVIGHSMGGYIAADLAATHPDAIDRLLLTGRW
ncbi:MAG: alpha/beta fold hydrolase [Roseiflexaceae bacterium]|nr:alpha/beta fold hydrolase [Roseiflexaceae bacterium]